MLEEKTKIKQHQPQFDEYQDEKDARPQRKFTLDAYKEINKNKNFSKYSEIKEYLEFPNMEDYTAAFLTLMVNIVILRESRLMD